MATRALPPLVLYWRSLFATVRWRRYRTEFSVVCRSSGECVAKFISRGLARSAVLRVQSCFSEWERGHLVAVLRS